MHAHTHTDEAVVHVRSRVLMENPPSDALLVLLYEATPGICMLPLSLSVSPCSVTCFEFPRSTEMGREEGDQQQNVFLVFC